MVTQELLLADILKQGGQTFREIATKPVIGKHWESTKIEIKKGKLQEDHEYSSLSASALELGALAAGLGVGIWFFTGGPQRTAGAFVDGVTDAVLGPIRDAGEGFFFGFTQFFKRL